MSTEQLIYFLLIGAASGWLAGLIMRGGGYGIIGNIILGIIGSFVGGWVLRQVGVSFGNGLGAIIGQSVVGAVVVLFIAGLFKR